MPIVNNIPRIETLVINKRKSEIEIDCVGIGFTDKDTRQFVIYIPSLDISGYGETQDKAKEMVNFCAHELCKFLLGLDAKAMNRELITLGWKHNQLKRKNYAKTYVDIDGKLQELNALEDKVNILDLELVG